MYSASQKTDPYYMLT